MSPLPRCRRALALPLLLLLLAPAAPPTGHRAGGCKAEAPIELVLWPLESSPAAGRYRVEAQLRLLASLEDVRLEALLPEGGSARLVAAPAALGKLAAGTLVRHPIEVEGVPGQGVLVVVGVSAARGGALLHRAAELFVGPQPPPGAPAGRVRVDAEGREVFEVTAQAAEAAAEPGAEVAP